MMFTARTRPRIIPAKALLSVLIAVLALSCDDGDDGSESGMPPPSPAAAAKAPSQAPKAEATDAQPKGLALPPISEMDFIAGPRSRDPFSPFEEVLVRKQEAERVVQRDVKLKEFDISDLKLIGIITNINDPRAMVVSPDGTGYVVRRGDYVGRADFVKQGAHGETIQVNWRVARVHGSGKEEERGVYFVRDDPTTTKGVDVTRFLPLYAAR